MKLDGCYVTQRLSEYLALFAGCILQNEAPSSHDVFFSALLITDTLVRISPVSTSYSAAGGKD